MSFYVTGGTLQSDAPSYVEREADRQLYEGLLDGDFCYVLTARQMGKSSLMVRTANRLRAAGVYVVALDLTALGGQNITPQQWYFGLLDTLGQELDLCDELEVFWQDNEHVGPLHRFMKSIRQLVLPRLDGTGDRMGDQAGADGPTPRVPRPVPGTRIEAETARTISTKVRLVIFVDEIDFVRSLPFSTDEFFAAIREWYNHRTRDSTYEQVTFCLLGVASPSDLIRDTRTTPFNIGRRIELNDFTPIEAAALAQGLEDANAGYPHSKLVLDRILYWTEGHPYLTQRLCRAAAEALRTTEAGTAPIAESPSALVDRLCADLFFSARARERDDNLIFVRERILRNDADLASVLDLYLKIWQGKRVMDDEFDPLISLLGLSGVARVADGRLNVRNRVYSRVFDAEWVRSNLPEAELRRQREAYRRGVIRAASLSSVVVLVMTLLAVIAVREATKQRQASAQAYFAQAKTERMTGKRLASLDALKKACLYHTNKLELRNEAIACLAIVDVAQRKSGKDSFPSDFPPDTTTVALNQAFTHYAVGDDQGSIRLVELQNKWTPKQLQATGIPVSWIALSPNGRFLAAQYGNANVQRLIVWDGDSEKSILSLTNHVGETAVDFSADSAKVAIGFPEGRIGIYSLPEGLLVPPLALPNRTGGTRSPLCVRFDPSGTRLAESSSNSIYVQIWDLTNHAPNVLVHRGPVTAIAWHPDGRQLATASDNHDLYLWDLRFSKKREIVRAHSAAVIDMAFSPQGDMLASMGADMALKLWSPATGREMTHYVESELSGRLYFSGNGLQLGYASVKQGIQMCQVIGFGEYRVFRAPGEVNAPFTSLSFSPEGRMVVAANDVGTFLWDAATGRELPFLKLQPVKSAGVHPVCGDLFASTPFGFYRWRCHPITNGNSLTLKFGPSECADLPTGLGRSALQPLGEKVAVVHENHVHLARMDHRSEASVLLCTNRFEALSISPDGKWLAGWIENQNEIQVWALDNPGAEPKPVKKITGSQHFAFSPNGKYLVTCWARAYHFWEVGAWTEQNAHLPKSVPSAPLSPLAFAWSTVNRRTTLAVADSLSTVKLFNMTDAPSVTLLEIARLESPDRSPFVALAFNRDGSRLAAATTDQTVQVWDLAKLREGLLEMGLAGDFPTFPDRSVGPFTVEFEADILRDTETPRKWQEVERLTTVLSTTAKPESETISKSRFQRGKLFMVLGRRELAKDDFEEALRLTPDDVPIREAAAALESDTTTSPERTGAAR